MDSHKEALLKVCRIGGRKFSSLSRPTQYPVSQFILELRALFNVHIENDIEGVHPPAICHICRSVVSRYQEAIATGCPFAPRGGGCGDLQEWAPHSRLNCLFCARLDEDRYKGRPKKKRKLWAGGAAVSSAETVASNTSISAEATVTSASQSRCSSSIRPTTSMTTGAVATTDDQVELRMSVDLPMAGAEQRELRQELGCQDADEEVPTTHNLADILWSQVVEMATPDYRSNEDCLLSPDRLMQPLNDLLCNVCKYIINQAVEAPCCKQLFCAECIWAWLNTAEKCPTCRHDLRASSLTPVHPRVGGILAEINVTCEYAQTDRLGCASLVQLQNLKLHVATCRFRPGATPHSPLKQVVTPSTTVQEILTASPSKLRGDVVQRVTTHLVQSQEEEGVLTLRSVTHGGKPQTWVRLTRAQTESNQASDRTLKRRSSEIAHVRDVICGGPSGSSAQHADELRRLRREQQEDLLREAGLAPKGKATSGTGLALKADLHLPWYKLRKLRRWLSLFGVSLESEAVMRQQISEELPFELSAELVPLLAKDGTILPNQ